MKRIRPAVLICLAGSICLLSQNFATVQIDVVPANPNDLSMYNHDPSGSRHNQVEHILAPATVGQLQVKWVYPTTASIAGTPAVVNDVCYAVDSAGVAYALTRDGSLLWSTTIPAGFTLSNAKVTASPLVTNRTLVIGDLSGLIHGLDTDTGAVKWTTRPNPHLFAAFFGSAVMVGNNAVVGVSSVEEFAAAAIPDYTPTFRGSLLMLDPADGSIVWQTFTISDDESLPGSSGSPIWSTPTYDRTTDTIYVTTGNNYSQPTNGTSDAFLAIDASTGGILWVNQRTSDDEWTFAFGDTSEAHPDFDIGDSPQIFRIADRTYVAAGQKSGFLHVLDAATGTEITSPLQLAPDGTFGGLFADSAYAYGMHFCNGSDWPGVLAGDPPNGGSLSAVSADGAHELWRFETPFSPNLSGVAVANGVVYFQTMLDGHLYALDALTGIQLAAVLTGGQSSGPADSRGRVYLGTGDTVIPTITPGLPLPPGSIVSLGIPGN